MSELDKAIDSLYEQAKRARWDDVLSEWAAFPPLARRCSRFQKASSGWTFLHQAAYFGHEAAARALIRVGAGVSTRSRDGKTPVDVAQERGHAALATLLRRAADGADALWCASPDPDLLPSTCLWSESRPCRAPEAMLVAYAGAVIRIPNGARYFADSFDRVLIGWHGTYDPPRGMDGEPST